MPDNPRTISIDRLPNFPLPDSIYKAHMTEYHFQNLCYIRLSGSLMKNPAFGYPMPHTLQ